MNPVRSCHSTWVLVKGFSLSYHNIRIYSKLYGFPIKVTETKSLSKTPATVRFL